MLAASIAILIAVIAWPQKKTELPQPDKNEILGMLQEQSQIASTEVTIRILFEADGIPLEVAREAMRLGAQKLPVHTKFIVRRDYSEEI